MFPFNQRALMSLWSVFFNPDKRYQANADRDAQWNRGAYLAEAMAHCGECHTPRNLAFALNNRRKFAGEVQAGWRAYNITPDHASGVGDWSDADLAHYLSIGHADGRGTAAGPMGEAVDASLKYLAPRTSRRWLPTCARSARSRRRICRRHEPMPRRPHPPISAPPA